MAGDHLIQADQGIDAVHILQVDQALFGFAEHVELKRAIVSIK